MVKFLNSPQDIIEHLEKIKTSGEDIKRQIEKIISQNNSNISQKKEEKVFWDGNDDYVVKDLEKQLMKLTKNTKKAEETDRAISEILSQISYDQIPIVLNLIESYPFQTQWRKYSFM